MDDDELEAGASSRLADVSYAGPTSALPAATSTSMPFHSANRRTIVHSGDGPAIVAIIVSCATCLLSFFFFPPPLILFQGPCTQLSYVVARLKKNQLSTSLPTKIERAELARLMLVKSRNGFNPERGLRTQVSAGLSIHETFFFLSLSLFVFSNWFAESVLR